MADEKTYVFDGASSNNIPLAYALNNGYGNGGFGLGGWGGGIVGFLLGLAFGGGWGGFGGFGNGGFGGGVGSLAGDIGMEMFPIAKRFLCEHCSNELSGN